MREPAIESYSFLSSSSSHSGGCQHYVLQFVDNLMSASCEIGLRDGLREMAEAKVFFNLRLLSKCFQNSLSGCDFSYGASRCVYFFFFSLRLV